ncbi:MAG: MFS transporter, partial [Brooklawnia sp.]
DHVGPQATVLFGVVVVGLALIIITGVIMHTDRLRLRFDWRVRGWLRLERPALTEDIAGQVFK